MPWIYALVGLLVGTLLGVIVSRLTTPGYKKQKSTQKELETAKFELEQQKQDLADHFAQTADMLDSLGKEYTKLYQHMTKTSSELLPNIPVQDNPFNKKVAEQSKPELVVNEETDESPNEAPKDYASGATGLLKEEKKEILDSEQVVTAKAS
ncbi:membrane protein [Vibrio variabilis]|uniref:Z-ring associated protein G n=1 Tax=Vibrio variabilis TaxID=990271 RepID=A0ABR4Y9J2_9VIBR|nr:MULTISPECIES: Z-ring associated protein ZapG [Vibrio]KHA60149.1 membrane protein [Vibrio variabilis]KHT45409.1 membrane protein [Vibrio sinaloensis]KIE20374.1 membrane protein [Vibrio sinaloensis]CAK4069394.1 Inner membrane protein YhcB [Vibrio sp. 16]